MVKILMGQNKGIDIGDRQADLAKLRFDLGNGGGKSCIDHSRGISIEYEQWIYRARLAQPLHLKLERIYAI